MVNITILLSCENPCNIKFYKMYLKKLLKNVILKQMARKHNLHYFVLSHSLVFDTDMSLKFQTLKLSTMLPQ